MQSETSGPNEAPQTIAEVVHDAGLHFGPLEMYGKRVDGSEGLLSLKDQVALMARELTAHHTTAADAAGGRDG